MSKKYLNYVATISIAVGGFLLPFGIYMAHQVNVISKCNAPYRHAIVQKFPDLDKNNDNFLYDEKRNLRIKIALDGINLNEELSDKCKTSDLI